MCDNVESSFAELEKECLRLNDYSSQPRYPFELELTDADMRLAIKDCGKISKFVKAIIISDELKEEK